MYHLKMVHTNRNMSWSVIKFDTKANYCFDCIINKRCVVGPLRLYINPYKPEINLNGI
jgi:hypothetical protein